MEHPRNPTGFNQGVFRTERILQSLPEQVFQAFARPEWLARWWGPNGFTNTFQEFDFRSGGAWKFVMHGPDGSNYPNESVFREIVPFSTIVIEHVCPPYFTLTIRLAAHERETHIRWIQEFNDREVAAAVRHIVEPANEQNLDRLEKVLSEIND